VAGADIRRFSADQRGATVNSLLVSGTGALAALADTMILPIIVLAFFVGQLTTSYTAVGMVAAIASGFWALARIPAEVIVSQQRRKMPWALGASIIRAVALGLLAFAALRIEPGSLTGPSPALLRTFFFCFAVFAIVNGFASVPMDALVVKAIPSSARFSVFRQRAIAVLVMSVIGGVIANRLLGPNGPSLPRQFGLLILAAAICYAAIAVFITAMNEPQRVAERLDTSPLTAFNQFPHAIRDGQFVRFSFFRIILSLTAIADPFFIIYGLSTLGVRPTTVGAYVVAMVLGVVIGTPLWTLISRSQGHRLVLQCAALLRLLPPLIALVMPQLIGTTFWQSRFSDMHLNEIVFGAIFVCLGASIAGQGLSTHAYLADITVPRFRGAYTGMLNVVLAVVALTPILGGVIIGRRGFDALFVLLIALGIVAVFISGFLPNTFVRSTQGRASSESLMESSARAGR